MTHVYLLYTIGCVISLLLYRQSNLGAKIGFSLSTIASAYGVFYFLFNLTLNDSTQLSSSLLYSPTLSLNPLGNFFSFVITFISFASSIYAIQYAKEYEGKGNLAVMAALFNAFILTMLLVLSASDVFWFMICWELMTLISYFLICFNNSEVSMKATILYMGIAHIGGACILLAFLLLSMQSGSLQFSSFENIQLTPTLASCIFLLAFVGFGSKAGMFPFHVWLPKAHPAAPTNVSALMSGVMIKVALFGIIKFCLWLPVMEWWGLLVIIIGGLSALLGVLYALTQHDYKALLAYHSVENIGIILLGIGTGIYGLAINSVTLTSIGFLAGLYHILNHATFKGLLFLGAGSVLYRTHTKDMEILGGLAKKMPLTAIAFLVGSMAITALPPLNGFVSEWFTYQAMMQGALGMHMSSRLIFTLSVLALALTGTLAVMCFVKVYSVIFGGTPRDINIYEKAKEAPISMIIGMFILLLGCIIFGLGAHEVVENILCIISSFNIPFTLPQGTLISAPIGSSISMPFIALVLIGTLSLPFVIIVALRANKVPTRETDPWACGFKYNQRMQITASPFTGNLKRLMEWLFKSKPTIQTDGYFKPITYLNHPKDIWWNIFYEPIIKCIDYSAQKISSLHNGSTNLYSAYILGALCLFLGISQLI